ncbi:MAG: cyclic nucleotide-binding/CBS domain-containing protein, partial [Nitrosarchaeum sp.]
MSHANKKSVTNVLDGKVFRYMSSTVLKLLGTTLMPTACAIMQKNDKDEIIVIDDNNTPIGIVTDQDVLKKIGEQYANPNKTRLDDIMTFPLITIKHNDTLLNALKIMMDNNVRKI